MKMHTSLHLWFTRRKRMVMTRASGGKHHPVEERSRGELQNPLLSFTEYRRENDGCWVCYGKE